MKPVLLATVALATMTQAAFTVYEQKNPEEDWESIIYKDDCPDVTFVVATAPRHISTSDAPPKAYVVLSGAAVKTQACLDQFLAPNGSKVDVETEANKILIQSTTTNVDACFAEDEATGAVSVTNKSPLCPVAISKKCVTGQYCQRLPAGATELCQVPSGQTEGHCSLNYPTKWVLTKTFTFQHPGDAEVPLPTQYFVARRAAIAALDEAEQKKHDACEGSDLTWAFRPHDVIVDREATKETSTGPIFGDCDTEWYQTLLNKIVTDYNAGQTDSKLKYSPVITVEKFEKIAEYQACASDPEGDFLGEGFPHCIGDKTEQQPNCNYLCNVGKTCTKNGDCGTNLCATVKADSTFGPDPDGDGLKTVCISSAMMSFIAPVFALVAAVAFF